MTSSAGGEYLVFRPLLAEFVVSMPRGAAVVYPKDAAQIVAMADIFPGAHVVEAGVGSGALTCSLLRAVGPHGRVSSYERREEFADVARAQRRPSSSAATHPAWRLTVGDLAEALPASGEQVDRVILDMLAPWECVDARRRRAARPAASSARTSPPRPSCAGSSRRCGRTAGSPSRSAWESLVRDWHVEGLAVRPGHKMNGHTGVPGHRPPDGAGRAARREEAPPGAGCLRRRLRRSAAGRTCRRGRPSRTTPDRSTRPRSTRTCVDDTAIGDRHVTDTGNAPSAGRVDRR